METTNGTMVTDGYNDTYYLDFPPTIPAPWGFWVKFISTLIIVAVGIIGNFLSFIVMKSKTLRHKSYSHYLCALAVFDTINLITRVVTVTDEYYIGIQRTNGLFSDFSDWACKLYNYTEHVAYLMSTYLVVVMAIERLTAVWFPFRKMIIRRPSVAAGVICGLLVLVGLTQVFRLVLIEHVTLSPQQKACAAADRFSEIYSVLAVYVHQLTLVFILPVVIVLTCNTLVVYQIIRVRSNVKQTSDKMTARHSRSVRKTHHTTCMLLAVSFTYIITLLPLFLLSLIIDINVRSRGPEAWPIYVMLQPYLEVATAFSLINYAVNFFIYVLSGRCFRYELRQIFYKERPTRRSFTGRSTREEFVQL